MAAAVLQMKFMNCMAVLVHENGGPPASRAATVMHVKVLDAGLIRRRLCPGEI